MLAISQQKKVKAIFLHHTKEKPYFHSSNAVLLISVGQPKHEGIKLAATLELVNKNFKSCDIAVCDVLQRHTMQIHDSSPQEMFYMKSVMEGKAWIERNSNALKLIKIPSKIFRWEEYLLADTFERSKKKIISLYQEDSLFEAAMVQTIKSFIARHERRLTLIDKEKYFNCCFNYLVEETAIIILMWQKCQYNYILYPGSMPAVLMEARNKFVMDNNPNLLKWVEIHLKNKTINSQ